MQLNISNLIEKKFKENAIKPIFTSLQNHLHWYILLDAYFQNTDVSFLKVAY